ncbi:hypothetical protein EWM64_g2388 [Hericium alpestre]|uniref:Lectin n=1 Tax=Hericium alpestre TaxID=135208 RepID=A0A4Z0A7L0_9AGAM|nr:hypothetical protein EWM64_g2388 [Hericium alpestre]
MAYVFNVIIAQSLTTDAFFVAEKSVWHYAGGGVWKHPGNSGEPGVVKKTFVLNGSGTCGALRFANEKGEYLVAVLGIHNDRVWVDVASDLGPSDVLGQILPKWYDGGPYSTVSPSGRVRKNTSGGKLVDMNVTQRSGSTVEVFITIGNNEEVQ